MRFDEIGVADKESHNQIFLLPEQRKGNGLTSFKLLTQVHRRVTSQAAFSFVATSGTNEASQVKPIP